MKTILLLACIIALYGLPVWYIMYRVAMYKVREAAQKITGSDISSFRGNDKTFGKFLDQLTAEVEKLPSYVSTFFGQSWIERLGRGLAGRNESIRSAIGENAGIGAFIFIAVLLLIGLATIDMLVILGFALFNKFPFISIGLILFGISIIMICAEFIMIRSARIIRSAGTYSAFFAAAILIVSWAVSEFILKWKF